MNEGLIENGNQIIVNQPMDHAVTDTSYGDFTTLVVAHGEGAVRPVTVMARNKITVQSKEVLLKIKLESIQFRRGPFSFAERKPALPNIF